PGVPLPRPAGRPVDHGPRRRPVRARAGVGFGAQRRTLPSDAVRQCVRLCSRPSVGFRAARRGTAARGRDGPPGGAGPAAPRLTDRGCPTGPRAQRGRRHGDAGPRRGEGHREQRARIPRGRGRPGPPGRPRSEWKAAVVHGEYKVPGGKLVVVDVEVEDGVLRHVRVAGDFFLEPDEALDAVNGALEGAPAGTDAAGLAARIEAALPAGTVMYGLTSEGIAIAVRRALAHATDWTDYDWQLIRAGPQDPALHMALEEVLTAGVAAGRRPPTLRVWEWAAPAVIIGSFQSLRNEVDAEGARRHGIEVVRRISGGGAMFVEPGNTITYSLSVPEALVQGLSFQDSYAYLDDWVLGALGDMGIRAWYQPLNDIATDQGKIAGAA